MSAKDCFCILDAVELVQWCYESEDVEMAMGIRMKELNCGMLLLYLEKCGFQNLLVAFVVSLMKGDELHITN